MNRNSFISTLAFANSTMLAVAKVAVLIASVMAGIISFVIGYKFLSLLPADAIPQNTSGG